MIKYRIYSDGIIIHEDDFGSIPEDACDDYAEFDLPEDLVSFIEGSN